jgi:hypothetical protein
MIDEELLKRLSKSKDPDVKALVDQVGKMLESPYYDPFISLLVQKTDWNRQYREKGMNLFDSDDKPVFEVAHKFFLEMKPYLELEEYLRQKLTPEQQEKAKVAANAFERNLQRRGVLNAE